MNDPLSTAGRDTFWQIFSVVFLYALLLFGMGFYILPWTDEAQFADPGANLHFSRAFVSTMWPYQTHEDVFLGNAPLFSFLLGFWFDAFGFGVTQARALSWFFGVTGLCATAWAINAAAVIPRRVLPWLLVLIGSGYGLIYSATSARYDTLGLLLIALLLRSMLGPSRAWKSTLRTVVLLAIPLAGFHIAIVASLIFVIRLVFFGWHWRTFFADCFRLGLGVVLLLTIAALFVDLKHFVFITLFSAHTVAGQVGRAVASNGPGFISKFAHVFGIIYRDPSYGALALLTCFLWVVSNKLEDRDRRVNAALAAGTIFIPISLALIGKYPIYYSWIGWVSLCVLFVRTFLAQRSFSVSGCRAVSAVACLIALSGPVIFAATSLSKVPASPQEASSIHDQIRNRIAVGDLVYTDMSAYFDVRVNAQYVYAFTYANNHFLPGLPTPSPITKFVVQSGDASSVEALVGRGPWVLEWKADKPLARDQKPLEIWSRSSLSPPS